MDHATAVVVRVTRFEKELNKLNIVSKSPDRQRRLSESVNSGKKN